MLYIFVIYLSTLCHCIEMFKTNLNFISLYFCALFLAFKIFVFLRLPLAFLCGFEFPIYISISHNGIRRITITLIKTRL